MMERLKIGFYAVFQKLMLFDLSFSSFSFRSVKILLSHREGKREKEGKTLVLLR